MPGLSGSDRAYRYAYLDESDLGKTRLDSTRLGHFPRNRIPVYINGAVRRGVELGSIRITLNTGAEAHTATFRIRGGYGFTPLAGHQVVIGEGSSSNPLFGGRLRRVTRESARNDEPHPWYRCEASGYLIELSDIRLGNGLRLTSVSATSVVRAILATTTPSANSMGFSTQYLGQLPMLSEVSVGVADRVPDAIDKIMREAGAQWHIDADRNLIAYQTFDARGPDPTTLTSNASTYWNLSYTPFDASRAFSQAVVFGALVQTKVNIELPRHKSVVIDTPSLLVASVVPGSLAIGLPTAYLMYKHGRFNGRMYGRIGSTEIEFYDNETGHTRVSSPATFGYTSRGANSLIVVSENYNSWSPISVWKWFQIAGQWLYAESLIGVYSMTVNTIGYAYYMTGEGFGTTNTLGGFAGDVPSGTPITSGWHAYFLDVSSATDRYGIVSAGAEIQCAAVHTNSTTVDRLSSIAGSAQFGLTSRVFEDRTLPVTAAIAVASTATDRGRVDQWSELEFATRDRWPRLGRPVYASIASIADASSISGTFNVQDLTIAGFERLTTTKGPERRVVAAAVRKPSLWQVLQGVS